MCNFNLCICFHKFNFYCWVSVFSLQQHSCLLKCSVQFSHSFVSNYLWPHEPQHTRPSCPSPTPAVYPNSYPLSWWCHPIISSSVVPFSSRLQSAPIRVFSNESDLPIRWPKDWSFSSASVLPMNIQDWFPLGYDGLVGSPCCPRDSQESSPTPQFKSINSLLLSFLYSPTLTSIHDHRKNHSFD